MSNTTKKPSVDITHVKDITPEIYSTFQQSTQYIPPTYKFDVIPSATGSVYAEDEIMKCTVGIFGPRTHLQSSGFSDQGVITCDISYAPYATHHLNNQTRKQRLHQKSSKETEMITILQELLSSSIQLQLLQKHEIYISVVIHQGSSCQWYDLAFLVNAISIALTTSGIALFDMVTATTIYILPDLAHILPQSDQSKTNTTSSNEDPEQINVEITSQLNYKLSIYPPSHLLHNIITQHKIPYKPISMTLAYLPSLQQITYSKLQGQLYSTSSTINNESTQKQTPWKLLTQSTLDSCKLIHNQHKLTLKDYVQYKMVEYKSKEEETQRIETLIEERKEYEEQQAQKKQY